MKVSLQEMQELASRLGKRLKGGESVFLKGEIGAGKTTFTRFLIQSLNPKVKTVKSPTFTYFQEYKIPEKSFSIYHFDLYRVSETEKHLQEEIREILENGGVAVVEWPEKIQNLSEPTYSLIFEYLDETSRKLTTSGQNF